MNWKDKDPNLQASIDGFKELLEKLEQASKEANELIKHKGRPKKKEKKDEYSRPN